MEWSNLAVPLTAVAIFLTFVMNLRASRRLKAMAVMASFQQRYEYLMYELKPRAEKGEYPVDDFHDRFWNLQIDQFYAWQQGLITDDTYRYWMQCRRSQLNNFARMQEVTFREGWSRAERVMTDTEFADFVRLVFENGVADAFSFIRRKHRCFGLPYILR